MDYAHVNLQNLHPVFTLEQLTASLQAMFLAAMVIQAAVLIDTEALHRDILSSLPSDPTISSHFSSPIPPNSHWSVDAEGLLRLDNRIYIPDSNDLHLCILRDKHDHC